MPRVSMTSPKPGNVSRCHSSTSRRSDELLAQLANADHPISSGSWPGVHYGQRRQRLGRDPNLLAGWGPVWIQPVVDDDSDYAGADRGAGDVRPHGRGYG